jgi:hypothetical protein
MSQEGSGQYFVSKSNRYSFQNSKACVGFGQSK